MIKTRTFLLNFAKTQYPALAALSVFNLSILFDSNFVSRTIILLFLMFVPGMALMGKLRMSEVNVWQKLGLYVSLSLLFIMLIGLLADLVFPIIFRSNNPLKTHFILPSIDVCFIIVLFFFRKYSWPRSVVIREHSVNQWMYVMLRILPLIFLLLSIAGALILNNGGSNFIAIFAQITLLGLVVFIILFRKKLTANDYLYAIFMMALGLLYSYSLRGGTHVLGWDINQEYRTYLATSVSNHWLVGGLNHDPYNACLSLTILPTIFHNFTGIYGELIFKVIYPIFFALTPGMAFLIAQKFQKPLIGFLVSVLFMSQIEFANEFPALARQEAAMLIISVLLLAILTKEFNIKTKKVLFITLMAACTLSHYSTTYTILLIFILMYLAEKILNFLSRSKQRTPTSETPITGILILFGMLFVFLWNLQVTQSSKNINDVVSGSILNISSILGNSSRSDQASLAIGFAQPQLTNQDLETYITQTNKSLSVPGGDLYADANQYQISLLPPLSVPAKSAISRIGGLESYTVKLADILVKISLIVGLILLLFRYRQGPSDPDQRLFSLICISAGFALIMFAVIPVLSIDYGFGRFFEETMLVLAIPIILGLEYLTSFLRTLRTPLICTTVVVYFTLNFGLRTQIFGGRPSVMLNNYGDDFNFYIHSGEVASVQWLADTNNSNQQTIYADIYSYLKFESMSNIDLRDINTSVLPSTVTKKSYVYLREANLSGRGALRDYSFFHQASVGYTFPLSFLGTNKNLIYANSDSEIYQ